jgi:hypothetical protein
MNILIIYKDRYWLNNRIAYLQSKLIISYFPIKDYFKIYKKNGKNIYYNAILFDNKNIIAIVNGEVDVEYSVVKDNCDMIFIQDYGDGWARAIEENIQKVSKGVQIPIFTLDIKNKALVGLITRKKNTEVELTSCLDSPFALSGTAFKIFYYFDLKGEIRPREEVMQVCNLIEEEYGEGLSELIRRGYVIECKCGREVTYKFFNNPREARSMET